MPTAHCPLPTPYCPLPTAHYFHMSGLVPIPSTRISGLLIRQRLTKQFQSDQLDLFRLQNQISTGQRIILPSDDAPAALRAISLQRLIERKGQLDSNIKTGQSFLAATDSALTNISGLLGDIRGQTLGVAGTVSSQQERDAVISVVDRAIEQLLQTGNLSFRGRFLFAGSQTNVQPYAFDGNNVVYRGNDQSVRSYSDIGVLFDSNAAGTEVFGGISAAVQGSVDLNPHLNADTLLSSLRGGRGITPNGSLAISDGTNTSIVDISNAVTVGDVVRFIEENPPLGRQISVGITGQGLTLQLDAAQGGNLTVKEVSNGAAARELGVLEEAGVLTNPLVGKDLDPIVRNTTRLSDLLGSKARTQVNPTGVNNAFLVEAASNGAQFNGVAIQFVDDDLTQASAGVSAGNEIAEYDVNARAARAAITFAGGNNDLILQANTAGTSFNNVRVDVTSNATGGVPTASYDSANKVLTIDLESDGTSNANQVIAAVAGLSGNPFTASLDTSVEVGNDGTGTIAPFSQADFANTGNSGGAAQTLYVRIANNASTANDVIAAINNEGAFTAKLDAFDTQTLAAAGTGIVDLNTTAALTSGGSGATLDKTSGIRVVNGGETFNITFDQADTVADLLNTINGSGAGLQAEINSAGSGINVRSRLSGNDFQIGENGGQTATQLGIRTLTGQTQLSDFNYGTGVPTNQGFNLPTVSGVDFSITSSDGQTFNIDLSNEKTPAETIAAINAVTTVNVTAQLTPAGKGIELVDNTAGSGQLTVAQVGGSQAAEYLGLVPAGSTVGVSTTGTLTGIDRNYIDFTITTKDGQTFNIDLSRANTVDDVLNEINAVTTVNVTAQLATVGNGIELVDQTTGAGQLTVTQGEGSQAAESLGLIPAGQSSNVSPTGTLSGTDQNFLENDSVFNTLIRLRDALQSNDIGAITRAIAKIDVDLDRVVSARAEVGARQQGLEIAQNNLQDEDVQLRSALSDEIDVDLVEAISNLTARQTSLEASLRATANILQLSLLNFI